AEPNISGGYIFKKDHEETWGEVTPSVDGRPMGFGGNSGPRYGYPTGPGGVPGDPAGFQAPLGGARRGGNNAGSARNGANVDPDSTTFVERLRMALSPNDGTPPPQPGAPAPRPRVQAETAQDQTRPLGPGGPGGGQQFTFRGDGTFLRNDGVVRSFRGNG